VSYLGRLFKRTPTWNCMIGVPTFDLAFLVESFRPVNLGITVCVLVGKNGFPVVFHGLYGLRLTEKVNRAESFKNCLSIALVLNVLLGTGICF
jgi:hypothetical protein